MTLIRAAVAAAVLIVPGLGFAAANETAAAPPQPAAEQVLTTPETDRTVVLDSARKSGRESEAVARAQVAPLPAPTKPKAVRPSKFSVVRAAPAPYPNWGCSGYWCGRQFVLMLGVGY